MLIDHNLLFAVLALQGDFLTQQQFLDICRDWTRRKQTPLAEMLVERGWLTPGDRAAVERLSERKLGKHGQDERSTLRAHLDEWTRQALLSLADAGITHVLAGQTSTPKRPAPPAPSLQPQFGRRERYSLVRLHASGGLGHIWLAHDPELDREVALKEIRPEHGEHELTDTRFLAEARITGRLEHPGVVPVYDLCKDGTGRPFYTMRFIQGRTLTEAIEEYHHLLQQSRQPQHADSPRAPQPALIFRELLQRFISVCQTLSYAHSKGYMHRDLKTDNVMLGEFGETLLVDWGLAKPFQEAHAPGPAGDGNPPVDNPDAPPHDTRHPDSFLTQQGNIIGTPMFMAPEQTIGDAKLLGPWTDIHGLGMMLYVLLTGKAPFTGDVVEVMLKIRQYAPVPPSHWSRTVPPALEAVCLKALAKNPADRYASAAEVAADIQRWLADEPVLAWREPWSVRSRRWVKRHRLLFVAAAATLLVGVVALFLSTLFLSSAKQEAERQRDRADENFDLARDAADQALAKLSAHPRLRQPDLADLRRELLATVVPFYEQFVRQRRDDPRLEAARGTAYGRLALVRWELGQEAQAIADLHQMREVYQRLAARDPQDRTHRHELASCLNNLGILLKNTGRRDEARVAFEDALRLQARLAEEKPGERQPQEAAAAGYVNLGNLLQESGQMAAAAAAYAEALRRYRRLAETAPEVTSYQQGMATCHNNLGGILLNQGRREEAVPHLEQGLAVRERLAENQTDPTLLLELARARGNLAVCWSNLEARRQEGANLFRKAAGHLDRLTTTYAAVPEFRRELGVIRQNYGALLLEMGDLAVAETELRKAATTQEDLHQKHSGVLGHAVDLGVTYLRLGDLQQTRQQPAAALEWYTKAAQVLEPCLHRDPRLALARLHLRDAYAQRAETLGELNRHAEAVAAWDQAIALVASGGELYQVLKACALARSGDLTTALTTIPPATAATPGPLLVALARLHALAAAQHPEAAQREHHTARALDLLTQAKERDAFKDRKLRQVLQTHKDFTALRDTGEFQKLLKDVTGASFLPRVPTLPRGHAKLHPMATMNHHPRNEALLACGNAGSFSLSCSCCCGRSTRRSSSWSRRSTSM